MKHKTTYHQGVKCPNPEYVEELEEALEKLTLKHSTLEVCSKLLKIRLDVKKSQLKDVFIMLEEEEQSGIQSTIITKWLSNNPELKKSSSFENIDDSVYIPKFNFSERKP